MTKEELVQEMSDKLGVPDDDILDNIDDFLNMERWVYHEMSKVCEDNEVVRKALKKSLDDYMA